MLTSKGFEIKFLNLKYIASSGVCYFNPHKS